MMKVVKLFSLTVAAALVLGTAPRANAVDVKAGSWDLSFTGDVNAFADFNACGHHTKVAGGLACQTAEGSPNVFAIESGLLPNAFVFTAKSRQGDFDVSATIGLYPGVTSNTFLAKPGKKVGLGQPSIDARQGFLTFGDKSWGTVKVGRDLGLFAGDAILSDMTLLSVGTLGAYGGFNTTLGHIGTGYIYADWIPQITYFSPSFQGFKFAVGVFQPMDTFNFSTLSLDGPNGHETPMVQAQLSYDIAGSVPGKVWVNGMFENIKVGTEDVTMVAGDAGVKFTVSGLGVLGYGYAGSGIGTTGIGWDAVTLVGGAPKARTSYGFLGQLTYQIPGTKLKPGVNYGMSFLKVADGEPEAGNPLVKSNATLTASLFYALTESVTLVAEYSHDRSVGQNDDVNNDNVGALGAIMFF